MPDTYISPPSSAFHEALGAIVGEKGLVTDPQAVQFHTTNWQGLAPGRAAAVVKPATTEEVAAIVKLCNQHNVKIVPQGGLTGLMTASIPVRQGDELVVSLARMNRILDINPQAYTMTVESGVVLQTIQQTAMDHDRLFPISLGAQGSCMIGGNLSTNAGGAQVLHYGNTRSMVLGLEVVLPDGRIWDGMRALKKDNTGYDLKDLFVGAEGTLGIITKAVLKVFPKPKDVATCWLAIPNPKAAFELLAEARMASGDCVTSCELVHGIGYESVLKHVPNLQRPIEGSPEWQLLMEWSSTRAPSGNGAGGMAERMEEFLVGAFERGLAIDGTLAQSEAQARNMWAIREGHAEASRRDPNPSCSFDISVAVHEIPDFIERCNAACVKAVPSIRPKPMGHMGDGNLHYSFGAPLDVTTREAFLPMVKTLDRIVHDMVNEIGGSISAEHGIGSVKLLELEHYRSSTELDIMRAIKKALDPKGLMNPGKVIRVDPNEKVPETFPMR